MAARKGQPAAVQHDLAYQPDWKERVKKRYIKPGDKRWNLRASEEFIILLRKAARRRGMNNAAYARRAIAAFISHDLQMPFEDICETFPAPVPEGFTGFGVSWPHDDGQGFGEWEVKP